MAATCHVASVWSNCLEKPPPEPNWSVAISAFPTVWPMKRVAPMAVTHGEDAGHDGQSAYQIHNFQHKTQDHTVENNVKTVEHSMKQYEKGLKTFCAPGGSPGCCGRCRWWSAMIFEFTSVNNGISSQSIMAFLRTWRFAILWPVMEE